MADELSNETKEHIIAAVKGVTDYQTDQMSRPSLMCELLPVVEIGPTDETIKELRARIEELEEWVVEAYLAGADVDFRFTWDAVIGQCANGWFKRKMENK